jgi:molecular chaperone DnaJ
MAKNYFEVLGLTKDAITRDIKTAYRKLAGKYHPDKLINLDADEQKVSEEKFKEIKEAYEVLENPKKRQDYIESQFTTTNDPRKVVHAFWENSLN